jgi:hypothetical protein
VTFSRVASRWQQRDKYKRDKNENREAGNLVAATTMTIIISIPNNIQQTISHLFYYILLLLLINNELGTPRSLSPAGPGPHRQHIVAGARLALSPVPLALFVFVFFVGYCPQQPSDHELQPCKYNYYCKDQDSQTIQKELFHKHNRK